MMEDSETYFQKTDYVISFDSFTLKSFGPCGQSGNS